MIDLISVSYYFCVVLLLLSIGAVVRNFKSSLTLFNQVPLRYWLFLSVLFVVTLFLRLYVVPHQHYVFYDEYEHINVAKNMAEQRQFARCNLYLDGKCEALDFPQWTPGYHFLLSIIFNIFGPGESVAYNFNAVLGALAIVVIFLILYLITRSEKIGFISSVLLAFMPLHLKFSGNSSAEIASFLFILMSVLALMIFSNHKTDESFFQLVTITAYTLLVRPENGLILLLFAVWLLMQKTESRYYSHLAGWIVLFIPYLLYLSPINEYQQKYWPKSYVGSGSLKLFVENLLFLISNKAVPFICIFMAGVGGYAIFKKQKQILIWLLFFLLSLVIFYTLVPLNFIRGEHQRFILQFYFPFIVLSAIGYEYSWQWGCSLFKRKGLILFIVVFMTILNFSQALHYLFVKKSPAFFHQQNKFFLAGRDLDSRYVFVAYNPSSIISTINKSCVHISYLLEENKDSQLFKDRDFILVNDHWCDSNSLGLCKILKNKYEAEEIPSLQPAAPASFFYRLKKRN